MKSRQYIYLDILYLGLLHIRAHDDDADQCHIQADHLHNLPGLLKNLEKEELHEFYWRVSRTGYIQRSKPEYVKSFESLWKELEEATQREQFQEDRKTAIQKQISFIFCGFEP